MCLAWRAAGAGLPELWESVEAGYPSELKCTEALLRWLAAWCATPQRPLRRLGLYLYGLVIAPGLAAGLVAVLHRSSTSLQHLKLEYNNSLWEQLMGGERAQESGFLAAIAALQHLTSLDIRNGGAVSCRLPRSTLLPTSLQRLVYDCGELPRLFRQLTRLEHVSLGHTTPHPASLALLPSLRGLTLACCEVPAQLSQLTRLEELELEGGGGMVCETDQHATALIWLTRVRMAWRQALAVPAHCADLPFARCPCSSRRWCSMKPPSTRCPPAGPRCAACVS